MRNRKLLEYINRKIVDDLEAYKDAPKKLNFQIEWMREDKVIRTRQLLSESFEKESTGVARIDHPMYFRRRFLKSKLINDEVNELRADESSLKNQTYLQELYGEIVDENDNLLTKELIDKLYGVPGNQFIYTFKNDKLDGPVFIMYAKRKIVFSIRLDRSFKVPK